MDMSRQDVGWSWMLWANADWGQPRWDGLLEDATGRWCLMWNFTVVSMQRLMEMYNDEAYIQCTALHIPHFLPRRTGCR